MEAGSESYSNSDATWSFERALFDVYLVVASGLVHVSADGLGLKRA